MEQILIVREVIVKFFKRYEAWILPILKFALGYFVFSSITSIGYTHASLEPFAEEFSPLLLNVLFAVLFTVMPMNLGWLLIILTATAQFSANLEIAIAVFVFLLFIFVFYVRMATKESIIILFTIMAFHFNVPYLIPIIAGLYLPITSIIPITLGVFINAQIPVLFGIVQHTPTAATAMTELEIAELLTELPEAFSVVYETIMHSLTVTQTWLFTAVIFAMVVVLVHFVSRLSIDFSKEIAIALGCVMNVFGFIVAVMIVGEMADIGRVIALTVVCGLFAWLIRCFDSILDYQRAESVQFEDDHNYYHVRIVPKVILTKSKRVVKRIRPDDEIEDEPPVRRPRPAPGTGRISEPGERWPIPRSGTGPLPLEQQTSRRSRPIAERPREQEPRSRRPRLNLEQGLENMPVRRPRPALSPEAQKTTTLDDRTTPSSDEPIKD